MLRVLNFHEKWLRRVRSRGLLLLFVVCGLLAVGIYGGYTALGSDLLPEMDEGGFILDYIMPAGSSLAETDRVLQHVERMLQKTPKWRASLAGRACRWAWPRSPRPTPATSP